MYVINLQKYLETSIHSLFLKSHLCNTFRQENPLDHHIFSDEPLTIEVCKATKFLDCEYDVIERYPMRSKPRGLVLIITNIYYESSYENPRFSAKHDNNNLKKLFEEMGFTVDTYQNLTGQVKYKYI